MKEVIKFSEYTHRFLARFVIEAKNPLAVGSGEKDILTDALVATDVNGLPYIPGTAIAGVVRHMLEHEGYKTDGFFGFQKGNDGCGSEIIFTEGRILNSKGEVIDGLNLEATDDELLKFYTELPIRQHVRINEKGVADKDSAGKFDEQVCFAGTRFCFEMEMVAKDADESSFDKALEQIQNKTFRIGGGTRCGFGEIEVVDIQTRNLDLTEEDQRNVYLGKSSALNSDFWSKTYTQPDNDENTQGWTKYELHLHPEDFFLFGSGFGDDEVDMTPVKEKKVIWKDGKGEMSDELVLIPATSVKGALAHRVAFYWNKKHDYYAGDERAKVGKDNPAVQALFGSEGEKDEKDNNKMKNQLRGNLLFSDVIEDKKFEDKILNHVAIDRFTGGAIDGALFSEKTTYGKGYEFTLTILAKEDAMKDDKVRESLEAAMEDLCKGLLPLGGGVNRGNGVFTGSLTKNGELLYESK